jgi:hypothetical protein
VEVTTGGRSPRKTSPAILGIYGDALAWELINKLLRKIDANLDIFVMISREPLGMV